MKMRNNITIFVLLLLLGGSAQAGVIRILLNPVDVYVNESGDATAKTELINMGDEAAENVRLNLVLPEGFGSDSVFVGTLETNKPRNISFGVRLPDSILPGVYPAVVMTDYTDLNGYPFSSVTPGVIKYREDVYPLLFASMDTVVVREGEKAVLPLALRNLDDRQHNLSVRLYLPREIKSNQTLLTVSLEGKSDARLGFEVSPFGALPKSSYLTFVSVEYEESKHYMAYPSKPGVVSIEGEEAPSQQKGASSTDKAALGEKSWVKLLPYALIVVSVVVIYINFRVKD
jgi:hypothetical protein